jgi:hypothetical protein
MASVRSFISTAVLFNTTTTLPMVDDPDQRNLGDCYFVEALAEIANKTNAITNIFLT